MLPTTRAQLRLSLSIDQKNACLACDYADTVQRNTPNPFRHAYARTRREQQLVVLAAVQRQLESLFTRQASQQRMQW